MAATVGSISIDLSTNAAKFASGFKSAATTVESQSARMAKSVAAVERGVNGIGGTLKNFGTGLVAGAGIAGLASLTGAFDKLKETISQYDEIATNAKQTGLNTDTYQSLAFAAKQANVEQESFNSALTIFAKNAGLAERGTGALFSSLQKLNPQLLQNIVNTKDQETRLKLVADALAQTTDASQKAALAAAVFGKGGVEMARFLDQGSASIERMKQTAKGLGIIIPDNLLQKAGELDDKLDVLQKVIDVNVGESLINLSGLLVGITQGVSDFTVELKHFSEQVNNFKSNPSLDGFLALVRGDAKRGLLDDVADGVKSAAAAFTTSTDDIERQIAEVQQRLADLKVQAEAGIDVEFATERAQEDLKFLQEQLAKTQAAGVTAANAIRAGFAQAFREAENASMEALAALQGAASSGTGPHLPNVIRYGGDPNKIELPDQSRNVQTNVNGSGVTVTKYNADTADNTKETAGYARDTADNIDTLDRNTNGYFRDLGSTVTSSAATISHSVSSLADLIGNEFGQLPSYLIAAIQSQSGGGGLNTGSISQPSNMFGDQWDPQHGSHVGPILNLGKIGSYHMPSTASDGSSNNQVSVAQPGSDITLNYYASPGESTETAKQRAREMFNELVLQASRA